MPRSDNARIALIFNHAMSAVPVSRESCLNGETQNRDEVYTTKTLLSDIAESELSCR